ncbi:hypothetical protein HU200_042729 [Digitaria exilis]|uniref:Uncharacterized protein n=1 Tax=Digitaria exilis TaxID=1010633 RepID=A0A835B5L0_9POAL|nr:hypothetical protein HU200_042729 [Digitaria exilis]
MIHLITNSLVAPQKRPQALMIRQQTARCHGRRKLQGMRRRGRRWGIRVRVLLRLRVRLSGVVGLLLRSVDELRCRPGGGCRTWSPAARAPGPEKCGHGGGRRRPEWDESSFYEEAIADCLEFIKSRSSYCPVNDGRV